MSARIYYDDDCDPGLIQTQTIGFIGYGNQGRAQALNLRDSGVGDIVVGNIDDRYRQQAVDDGFDVCAITDAAHRAQILFLLIPDEVQPEVWQRDVKPGLESGDTLVVSSGYNVYFQTLDIPEVIDVVMVAPRMVGEAVRQRYLDGTGYPCFVSAEQDISGDALAIALAIAHGVGATRAGAIASSAREEAALDLFAEQAVWPLIIKLFATGFEILKEAGFSEEAILYEAYLSGEPAEIFARVAEKGFVGQMPLHSRTSQYGQMGGLLALQGKADQALRQHLQHILHERILSGEFAREWSSEQQSSAQRLDELRQQALNLPITQAESRLLQD
jgi:ketol-acid reductoisomerase